MIIFFTTLELSYQRFNFQTNTHDCQADDTIVRTKRYYRYVDHKGLFMLFNKILLLEK